MTQNTDSISAAAAGTVQLGDLSVNRLGFGAMRLTGKGIWGPPEDRNAALATLRRAVELGVNFIDTADSYGPGISEELIAEALSPYPKGVVVATKGGWERVGPGQWIHNAGPKHLQEAVEGSLERLRLDHIDVYYLHIPDAAVSFDASVGALGATPRTGQDPPRGALQRYFGALASCPKDCSDRRRAKSLWFCRPRMGLSSGPLPAARNYLRTVGSAGTEPPGQSNSGRSREKVGCDSAAGGACMAAAPFPRHRSHSRNFFRSAPGRKRRRRRPEASRRRLQEALRHPTNPRQLPRVKPTPVNYDHSRRALLSVLMRRRAIHIHTGQR